MGCRNATVLNASAEDVWSALRNFHDLWGGVQDSCDPIYRALLTDMKAHFG